MGGGLAARGAGRRGLRRGRPGHRRLRRAERMRAAIAGARERTDRPVAANLLLPFTRRAHWEAAATADVVVTFWGRPRGGPTRPWLHQVGSVEEARAAARRWRRRRDRPGRRGGRSRARDGAGARAPRAGARARCPTDSRCSWRAAWRTRPTSRARSRRAPTAAVLGTRFVLSEEANAALAYKQRLMESRETVLTQSVRDGLARAHRVIWNEAAERWLDRDGREPRWLSAVQRATGPLIGRLPLAPRLGWPRRRRAARPFFGPFAPTADGPRNLLDAGALYAGESVARLHDIRPAAELVRELAPARREAPALLAGRRSRARSRRGHGRGRAAARRRAAGGARAARRRAPKPGAPPYDAAAFQPFAYEDRAPRATSSSAAATGMAHVVYALSPGGVEASVARTTRWRRGRRARGRAARGSTPTTSRRCCSSRARGGRR